MPFWNTDFGREICWEENEADPVERVDDIIH